MKKITRKTKLKEHPLFKGFPDELKNPDCYEGVEKRLALSVYSDHKHQTLKSYVGCKRCQDKLKRRRELMKEIGFVSVEQYMMWKKVMDIIINKRELSLKVK